MIFEKTGHGGDIYSRQVRYDFSANINPLGTPESVRQAVIDSANRIHQYPDPCCRELIGKIAEYEGVFAPLLGLKERWSLRLPFLNTLQHWKQWTVRWSAIN